ncbi:kinase domain protein (macronuclear) [Tetrahymena thermophila SB210]|uniref:Kinase domain protein n=1 Tax=Tetrahymena thermophila (strain SB210) TaxID=312017 RepID=Q22PI3_TETTS|nr:kinase domain protein [Tetrahymena thermophila SB210]EAR87126.2 kinase domain protein [Tetrahymena thermophila SB210]|eukprot:XP_001007371.2 kinase domain protein [Tetrahymena thermophila SB210]
MFGVEKNIFTKKKKDVQFTMQFSQTVDNNDLNNLLTMLKPYHKKIEIFFAEQIQFKSSAIQKFGEILMSIKNINYLQLVIKKCVLEGLEEIEQLALVLQKLQIQEINLVLQQSNLRQQGYIKLIQLFSSNKTVKDLSLDLSVNSLGPTGCSQVCQYLKNFENIQVLSLNLGSNTIKQSGAIALGQELSKLQSLKELNLNISCNSIGQDGIKQMLNNILKITALQTLDLNLNQNFLSDFGAKQIGVELFASKLQKVSLDLMHNSLSQQGIIEFLTQLNFSYSLITISLNLNENQIKNDSINVILENLSQLKRIKFLELLFSVERNTDTEQYIQFGRALKQCQYLNALKINVCDQSKFIQHLQQNNSILRYMLKSKRMIQCYAYS